MLPKNAKLKNSAAKLRKNMTKYERHLWYDFLKGHAVQFNRQRIIGRFIVDFYCHAANLIIEIDGSQHFSEKAEKYDEKRTEYLEKQGLKVLRFTNLDIDRNFVGVCEAIEKSLLSQKKVAAKLTDD